VIALRERKPVAPKLVLAAVEGFGKTTFGAWAPSPFILMARGETGYDTLLSAGRVPQVPAALSESWSETLEWVESLIADPQGVKTMVLDAYTGFERLCHEHVCVRDFGGNWGEHGFNGFKRGIDNALSDWIGLLNRLSKLNETHGVSIVLLSHVKVTTFKNPMGMDYSQFSPDGNDKTWAATARWADVMLFGNYLTIVDGKANQKAGKGIGGTDRMLYTERRDSFVAKNRYGLPPELLLPNDPAAMWSTVWDLIAAGAANIKE